MKEDYLWDKTGGDPEIKKLENALKAFRPQNTTPPEIQTARNFVIVRKPSSNGRNFFRLAVAGFACAGLLILAAGVFRVLQLEDRTTARFESKPKTTEIAEEQTMPAENGQIDETRAEAVESPKTVEVTYRPNRGKRSSVKTQPADKITYKRIKREPLKKMPKNTVRLTREEKEAYEQLMRALAITGSQMRIVREKIRGEKAETENPVKKESR